MDRLVAAFETMAGELKAIRLILDQVLDDFSWALNNDKLKPACCPNLSAFAELAMELAERNPDDPTSDHRSEASVTAPTLPDREANDRAAQRDLFS